MQMHPYISALIAAEHVKDLQAQGFRARRARAARRARRGVESPANAPVFARPTAPCPTCP